MPLPALSPPPINIGGMPKEWVDWFQGLYQKLGKASATAPLSVTGTSDNITGAIDLGSAHVANRLPSSRAAANLSLNNSNNVTADSIDVDASNCTVRVYGPGGVGTDWSRYEATATGYTTLGPYPATSFVGKAYATTYYIAFDPALSSYIISSDNRLVLPDSYFWVAQVAPNASFGGGGATSGGGGTGAGGFGGAGHGRFL